MSDGWRIEPEPTEEELAALAAVIASEASVQVESEPAIEPVSTWTRAARRESIEAGAGSGDRGDDRF